MFYNHHFFGMHWIWWIFWAAIVFLVVFNVFPFRREINPVTDAMEILKQRFAKGEIEKEEFEERSRILRQSEL